MASSSAVCTSEATTAVVAVAAPSATNKPLAATMKGRIASRAHSFKENLMEAFGHHHHQQGAGLDMPSNGKIRLAKKTNSSDNLIGYSEPKHNTDGLVRDIQLALRYFKV